MLNKEIRNISTPTKKKKKKKRRRRRRRRLKVQCGRRNYRKAHYIVDWVNSQLKIPEFVKGL
jgi:transcription initiation factor TFIIIB Brf1 subunit/transcription initiation factor TFIIB